MGEVYLAEDTRLGRKVALKLLPSSLTGNADRLRRFEQEARAASSLNQPNIITIYDIGKVGDVNFIAMEYIEGETLLQHIANKRMELSETINISIQVAKALSAAHKVGVIHRDIKPENIMVRPDGYVKVLDFGLAKLIERQPTPSVIDVPTTIETDPGVLLGTISYMSPEQIQMLKVDARTDIFSFGVVFYEMITGFKPFSGSTVGYDIVHKEPLPLNKRVKNIPADIQPIIDKVLHKQRELRYQSTEELLTDLNVLKQRLTLQISPRPVIEFGLVTETSTVQEEQSTLELSEQTLVLNELDEKTPNFPINEKLIGWITSFKAARVILIILLIAVLITGIFLWKFRFIWWGQSRSVGAEPFSKITVVKLTATGKSKKATISPDGRYVVYVMYELGQESLWVMQVETKSVVPIKTPTDAYYIADGSTFSPDGNYIYYRILDKTKKVLVLYRVPTLGGPSTELINDVDSPVSFSPDGKRIAFVRNVSRQGESAVIIANRDGTNEYQLNKRSDYNFFYYPAWSPDGNIIACSCRNNDTDRLYDGVIGIHLDTGKEVRITNQKWGWLKEIAWLQDGTGLIVNAADRLSFISQIWYLSYPGGEARKITDDIIEYEGMSLATKADVVVTEHKEYISNIYVASNGRLSQSNPITFGAGKKDGAGGISWTPDGKIVYNSNASGSIDIWIMNVDGGDQRQLTFDSSNDLAPSVSPDGRYIVFASWRADSLNIWRMNIDGSNPKKLTDGNGQSSPQCSRDGKWVIYEGIDDSRKESIWKISIEGGKPIQLSTENSYAPSISPDGKFIACFYSEDENKGPWRILVLPFTGGQKRKTFVIPEAKSRPSYLRWTKDGRALTYVQKGTVWSQQLDGSASQKLIDFKSGYIHSFEWSHDGKQVAYSLGVEISDIFLIRELK